MYKEPIPPLCRSACSAGQINTALVYRTSLCTNLCQSIANLLQIRADPSPTFYQSLPIHRPSYTNRLPILYQSITNPMSIQCQSVSNPIQSIQGCPHIATLGPIHWQSNSLIHYQYPDSMSICQSWTNPSILEQSWTNLMPILCQSADPMPT